MLRTEVFVGSRAESRVLWGKSGFLWPVSPPDPELLDGVTGLLQAAAPAAVGSTYY